MMLQNWSRLNKGTAPEHSLEPAIAALGVPYRWQMPVWQIGAVVDFALPKHMIVIEVDGKDHLQPKKKAADEVRTKRLEDRGWRVWRCTNEQALNDPYGTIARLVEAYPELKKA